MKHIFPEMKLRGLFPDFDIHVSGSNYIFPRFGFIWNIYFPVRELSAQSAVEPRVHINDQRIDFQFGYFGSQMETITPCCQFLIWIENE